MFTLRPEEFKMLPKISKFEKNTHFPRETLPEKLSFVVIKTSFQNKIFNLGGGGNREK